MTAHHHLGQVCGTHLPQHRPRRRSPCGLLQAARRARILPQGALHATASVRLSLTCESCSSTDPTSRTGSVRRKLVFLSNHCAFLRADERTLGISSTPATPISTDRWSKPGRAAGTTTSPSGRCFMPSSRLTVDCRLPLGATRSGTPILRCVSALVLKPDLH